MKRLTTEEFIEKAVAVHGDKYDYSKTEYVTAKVKICITCLVHGDFWQNPSNHLQGNKCPLCSSFGYTHTQESFLAKARAVHGDLYDYSNVIFTGVKDKVEIMCPIHGSFYQTPDAHFAGKACTKCGIERSSKAQSFSTEDFIYQSKKHHGDKYDYSNAIYIKSSDKIAIICPIHGMFEQLASSHMKGLGCEACGYIASADACRYSLKGFINRAEEIHGDKYSYDFTDYINSDTKVEIYCNKHGTTFWQDPSSHLSGCGCPQCAIDKGTGFINRTTVDRNPELAAEPRYLYYVKLTNRCSGKEFWKIGIEKTACSRWSTGKRFEVEYIWQVSSTTDNVLYMEDDIKIKYDTGVSHVDWPYSGRTEMLPYNFLEMESTND